MNQLRSINGIAVSCAFGWKSHMVGASLSLLIIFGIWESRVRHLFDPTHLLPCGTSIEDAIVLIDEGETWQRAYEAAAEKRELVISNVRAATQWLEATNDASVLQTRFETLASQHGVKVLSLSPGPQHHGSRIDVATYLIHAQGSFASLCRYVSDLTSGTHPVGCSQLSLRPTATTTELSESCDLTLSIRVPLIGSGTTASKLLASIGEHND